jgi:hypothetical protein
MDIEGDTWAKFKALGISEKEYPVIHLAHPGITRRVYEGNHWPRLHQEEHVPAARESLSDLMV